MYVHSLAAAVLALAASGALAVPNDPPAAPTPSTVAGDRVGDIARDRADLAKDRADLVKDREDAAKDKHDLAMDRADLKRDRADLRADRRHRHRHHHHRHRHAPAATPNGASTGAAA